MKGISTLEHLDLQAYTITISLRSSTRVIVENS